MIVVPALPEPSGPNPQRSKFYVEVAAAFEFLAAWYTLPAEQQAQLRAALHGAISAATAGQPPSEPESRPVARSSGPASRS